MDRAPDYASIWRHDHNTNRRKLARWPPAMKGVVRVFVRSNCATAVAGLATALALSGCDNPTAFSKPLNLFGNNLGYTYSQLDQAKLDRPITADNLIDANGACPRYAAPAPPPPAGNPSDNSAQPADANALLSGGVALGMSECEVISHLGQPNAFNVGANPNGTRSVVLTYNVGVRPGVYRFNSGRLAEMDRVEAPPPPAPEKKVAKTKKKPAKPAEPPATGDKS